MDRSDEGLAFPPVFVVKGSRRREGSAVRPRPGALPPCEMCGGTVLSMHWQRICLSCGYLAGYPRF